MTTRTDVKRSTLAAWDHAVATWRQMWTQRRLNNWCGPAVDAAVLAADLAASQFFRATSGALDGPAYVACPPSLRPTQSPATTSPTSPT